MNLSPKSRAFLSLLACVLLLGNVPSHAQQLRVELKPTMLTNKARVGAPSGLIDEHGRIILDLYPGQLRSF